MRSFLIERQYIKSCEGKPQSIVQHPREVFLTFRPKKPNLGRREWGTLKGAGTFG